MDVVLKKKDQGYEVFTSGMKVYTTDFEVITGMKRGMLQKVCRLNDWTVPRKTSLQVKSVEAFEALVNFAKAANPKLHISYTALN